MKARALRFLLWANLVISLGLSQSAYCQEISGEEVYYNLINDIISKDNIVSEDRGKLIAYDVETGKLSKADSIKYYNIVNKRELSLYRKKSDSLLRKILQNEKKAKKFMRRHVHRDSLPGIIESIPQTDEYYDPAFVAKKINLVGHLSYKKLWHKFSSAIHLYGDAYIVLHSRNGGGYNSYESQLLIFSKEKDKTNGYELIDRRVIHGHVVIERE